MCTSQQAVGDASRYEPTWLGDTSPLLRFVKSLRYTVYEYPYDHGSGVAQLKRAPKVEFFRLNDQGERPLYRWGQSSEMYQAGYVIPPELRALAARIESMSGERVNHCIVIFYEDGAAQHAPPHKDKAKGVPVQPGTPTDMARNGSFFVLSLGEERVFTLQRTRTTPPTDVVWSKPLASGSLLTVAAADNRALYHAVHKQPGVGARWSIIFRTVDTHVPVDEAAAARANGEGHRFQATKKRKPEGGILAFVKRAA